MQPSEAASAAKASAAKRKAASHRRAGRSNVCNVCLSIIAAL